MKSKSQLIHVYNYRYNSYEDTLRHIEFKEEEEEDDEGEDDEYKPPSEQ